MNWDNQLLKTDNLYSIHLKCNDPKSPFLKRKCKFLEITGDQSLNLI